MIARIEGRIGMNAPPVLVKQFRDASL